MRCRIDAVRKTGDNHIACLAALARNRGGELRSTDAGVAGADNTDCRLRGNGKIAFGGEQWRSTVDLLQRLRILRLADTDKPAPKLSGWPA